ncbi:hypothetical protein LIER_08712 [Lithospermum erythrorhizon]|uniref:LOB domain-containing protein n=1 Tax=Lithospermum erythrorhizon TaxID=34254 RepID=A0AAV3PCW1_LITER
MAAKAFGPLEIFRSLMYEACGRIMNPVYGSVGLLWTGKWDLCQKAVEAVLKGAPITQIESEVTDQNHGPPLSKTYDIRHANKEDKLSGAGSSDLHRLKNRSRFKKSGAKCKPTRVKEESDREVIRESSHESSSLSHQAELAQPKLEAMQGSETEKASVSLVGAELETVLENNDRAEVNLELTLGLLPLWS